MPTFNDPRTDAAEASEALRGLAHATRTFTDPADTYPVIGDLLAGVRSLQQALHQVADAHLAHQGQAYDDAGDRTTAARDAANQLHRAGLALDTVEHRLDAASAFSGRVAWHTEPEPRWVSIVFLQGEEADHVLDIIDHDGTDAAIEHLAGYDYGYETTDAALENGYVYDTPPVTGLDRTAERDVYTLVYSPFAGTVNLLREYDALPDPALLGIDTPMHVADTPPTPAPKHQAQPRRTEATDWFAGPASGGGAPSGRGLAL